MSCGCKNKKQNEKRIVSQKQSDGSIEIISEPPYTMEEVIEVKDYINSRTKTEEGRQKLISFNEKYFGELLSGYCDQACIERTRRRLDKATEHINKYNASKI